MARAALYPWAPTLPVLGLTDDDPDTVEDDLFQVAVEEVLARMKGRWVPRCPTCERPNGKVQAYRWWRDMRTHLETVGWRRRVVERGGVFCGHRCFQRYKLLRKRAVNAWGRVDPTRKETWVALPPGSLAVWREIGEIRPAGWVAEGK